VTARVRRNTQHIGAYTVEANGRTIAFVDTPVTRRHCDARARAKVTDIVVLVSPRMKA